MGAGSGWQCPKCLGLLRVDRTAVFAAAEGRDAVDLPGVGRVFRRPIFAGGDAEGANHRGAAAVGAGLRARQSPELRLGVRARGSLGPVLRGGVATVVAAQKGLDRFRRRKRCGTSKDGDQQGTQECSSLHSLTPFRTYYVYSLRCREWTKASLQTVVIFYCADQRLIAW